jgi:hypothetical protein
VLCRDGSDLPDPIGGPMENYRRCADRIDTNLEGWLPGIEHWSSECETNPDKGS